MHNGHRIPASAIGVYTYFDSKLGIGLKQLLAGVRKFKLNLLCRNDIAYISQRAKEVCKKMKKQKFEPLAGKVIHTASIAGVRVDNGTPVYSVSKAGIIAMMQSLAQSLAPKITVNAISPGFHLTGAYRNRLDVMKMTMDEGHVKVPLNRYGTVEDVVNVSVFLASPDSNFITGHNFIVDGGILEIGVQAYYFKSEYRLAFEYLSNLNGLFI